MAKSKLEGIKWPNKSGNKFLNMLNENEEARETVASFLKLKENSDTWRGYLSTPPGSPLDEILRVFESETDIPLELPFFSTMFFLSGFLMSKNIKINFGGQDITPETWTIVLAPSGSGKTFASGVIEKAVPVKANFPDCGSGAKFIECQKEFDQNGKAALWFQDEFAQKLKMIETPGSPLHDMKEYLLKTYSNSPIERTTKAGGTVRVEKPAMAILGMNTDEGFFRAVSAESMIDGFAQRFAYVIAERDPKRHFTDFPIYHHNILNPVCENAFKTIEATELHQLYSVPPSTEAAFVSAFKLLFDGDVPQSFHRRILFLAIKYSLLYHIILGKTTSVIDAQDMSWAVRLCKMHLNDAKKMINGSCSDLSRMVATAEKLKARCEAEGKPFNARAVAQIVSGIKTAAEAKGLINLVNMGA